MRVPTAAQLRKARSMAAYKAHLTRQNQIIAAANKKIKQIKANMARAKRRQTS
jgi:hypothetical protein